MKPESQNHPPKLIPPSFLFGFFFLCNFIYVVVFLQLLSATCTGVCFQDAMPEAVQFVSRHLMRCKYATNSDAWWTVAQNDALPWFFLFISLTLFYQWRLSVHYLFRRIAQCDSAPAQYDLLDALSALLFIGQALGLLIVVFYDHAPMPEPCAAGADTAWTMTWHGVGVIILTSFIFIQHVLFAAFYQFQMPQRHSYGQARRGIDIVFVLIYAFLSAFFLISVLLQNQSNAVYSEYWLFVVGGLLSLFNLCLLTRFSWQLQHHLQHHVPQQDYSANSPLLRHARLF